MSMSLVLARRLLIGVLGNVLSSALSGGEIGDGTCSGVDEAQSLAAQGDAGMHPRLSADAHEGSLSVLLFLGDD